MSDPHIDELMRHGHWDEAIAACTDALHIQPCSPRLRGLLGMCYFRLQRWDEAEKEFRKAVSLDPNFWEAGVKLAQSLDRLKRYDEAYVTAVEWLRVQPNDPALQALIDALGRYKHSNATDAWERTIRADAELLSTLDHENQARRR